MKIDKKDMYTFLYIAIAAAIAYFAYYEYTQYENNASSSNSTSTTTDANLSATPVYTSSSLAPINFNSGNSTAYNGVNAAVNSFLLDNVGDNTNSNLQSEFLNNSSYSSGNPINLVTAPTNVMPSNNYNINNPSLINNTISQSEAESAFSNANTIAQIGNNGGVTKQEEARPAAPPSIHEFSSPLFSYLGM